MNDTTNTVLDKRQQLQVVADNIMRLPRAERWSNVKKLLFTIHPEFIQRDLSHQAAVADIRDFQQLKATGATASGSMRHLFKIPEYIWHALKADPEFARLERSSEKSDIKKLHKSLWDAFPEYRTAQKY
jgi:hypothetical protein